MHGRGTKGAREVHERGTGGALMGTKWKHDWDKGTREVYEMGTRGALMGSKWKRLFFILANLGHWRTLIIFFKYMYNLFIYNYFHDYNSNDCFPMFLNKVFLPSSIYNIYIVYNIYTYFLIVVRLLI